MTPTDRVLGQLAAIQTFIENFPMNILDKMHGKTYTSIFDFLIDVLNACGVNTNEIIDYLLSEIYGVEASINGSIDGFYEQIKNGEIKLEEQNEFMEGLEMGIKGVLMALLSSIFTCSAIPILPNKVFDKPNPNSFNGKTNTLGYTLLSSQSFVPFIVPTSIIDPMGLLSVCPTSEDGRLFYDTQGRDVYYKKEYVETTQIIEETITATETKTVTVTEYEEKKVYETQVPLKFKVNVNGDEYSEDANIFILDDAVKCDISIKVNYSPYNSKTSLTWEGIIKAGQTTTDGEWICSPVDLLGQRTIINSITINGSNGIDGGDKKWVYLSREGEGWDKWSNNGLDSIKWGSENTITETIETTREETVTEDKPVTTQREVIVNVLNYVQCQYEDIIEDNLVRVDFVPEQEDVLLDSPDFIVHYEGLNPNTLYKTMDMNAFIWYALHKGMKNPQVEYNHMMWDSRISAAKEGNGRKSASEWNEWYNSKKEDNGEFKYHDSVVTDKSPIYPIIQLEPQGMAENLLRIHIPSQTYWMPKIREGNLGLIDKSPRVASNASIYKFNWDYLTNIRILQPKLLLIGLCESLLGFTLSTISSVNINLTKKLIEAKLSSAIKSIIEANDMEVEDCYTTFSNDEVNAMMEEMLLARYNATTYGGETSTVRVHDTKKYIDMLDKVNANTSIEGNISQIKKLITEVTVDPGTEGSINYGLQVTTDGNLLKKLLWAIAMPILMSIFTPQVLLLLYINLELMGITRMDEFAGNDFTKILNLLMNKIFGLVKSILLFIKDKIVELLLKIFYKVIKEILIKYELLLLLERLNYWLTILKAALNCLPRFKFIRNKPVGYLDNVDYADIIGTQDTPEATKNC